MKQIILFTLSGKDPFSRETTKQTIQFSPYHDSSLRLSVESVTMTNFTYHPAKMVYTGVSVGGVHTGGFHEEKAYHSTRVSSTDKGHLLMGKMQINSIQLSPELSEAVKSIPALRNVFKDGFIELEKPLNMSMSMILSAQKGDTGAMNAASFALANNAPRMDLCIALADFLQNAYAGFYLKDEEKIEIAKSLLNINNPKSWERAKNLLAGTYDETAVHLREECTRKLDSVDKWNIDGITFYNEKAYNTFKTKFKKAIFKHYLGLFIIFGSLLCCVIPFFDPQYSWLAIGGIFGPVVGGMVLADSGYKELKKEASRLRNTK